MIRPADIVIVIIGTALIAAMAANVYTDSAPRTLRVMQGNQQRTDYPAWQDRNLSVNGPLGKTVIEIRDGRARVLRSPCSNKLCLRAGWLDSAGDAVACLPNHVGMALLGGDARFDAINF